MIVDKAWGYEEVLINEPEYCCKRLYVYLNRRCSLHYHPRKKETFVVEQGTVRLEQRDVRGRPIMETLQPGDQRTIEPKTPHRFSGVTGNVIILEVSTHHDDADVVRIEPSDLTPDFASRILTKEVHQSYK